MNQREGKPEPGTSAITRECEAASDLANRFARRWDRQPRRRSLRGRCVLVAALACAVSIPGGAGRPRAPDKLAGPPANDYARATGSAATRLVTGSSVGQPPSAAMDVKLTALPDAELPRASTCASDDAASFAGFVRFEQWHSAGRYEISVTPDAWIDVVQDDNYVPPVAISGAVACPPLRKSRQFHPPSSPFFLHITKPPPHPPPAPPPLI